jgi:hypothetical protein
VPSQFTDVGAASYEAETHQRGKQPAETIAPSDCRLPNTWQFGEQQALTLTGRLQIGNSGWASGCQLTAHCGCAGMVRVQ